MSQALPLWVQIFQALLTPVIGIGILIVAFMQWRTAHQKVIVDIFERRVRIFEGLRKLNRTVIGAGNSTQEQFVEMGELWSDARFLFGREVYDRIDEARNAVWDIRALEKEMSGMESGEEKTATYRKKMEAFKIVQRFQIDLPKLFRPYMRLHTKAVLSPAEVLADMNERRRQEGP